MKEVGRMEGGLRDEGKRDGGMISSKQRLLKDNKAEQPV